MTVAALAWAFRLPLPTTQKTVLLALADFTDERESCFPGVALIADRASVSERTVKTNIAKLEAAGLLSRGRRYNGFGGRSSDRYVLHVGTTYERPVDVEVEDVMAADADDTLSLGANFAPNGAGGQESAETPSGAKFAPNAEEPVDNPESGPPLGATDAPLGANPAPLKEEPPERTPRKQSSSSALEGMKGPLDVAGMARQPDDEDDDGNSSAGDGADTFQRMLDAGVEVALLAVDARLRVSEIRRRLTAAGLDPDRVDIPSAAAEVLAASARPVGDASAYVAIAVIREPDRWPWSTGFVRTVEGGPAPPGDRTLGSGCRKLGCRYLDEWRSHCVRCGVERQGWRDDRDRVPQTESVPAS